MTSRVVIAKDPPKKCVYLIYDKSGRRVFCGREFNSTRALEKHIQEHIDKGELV